MSDFKDTRGKVHVEFSYADSKPLNTDWVERLFALGTFLQATDPNPKVGVSIYAFECEEIGGIRIAEVDFTLGNGGASYMRGDFDAQPTIARCEMFLATYGVKPHRPPGWESFINEHGEARINLLNGMGMNEAAEAEYARQLAEEKELAAAEN